jgi:hypothetical protein
VAFTKNHLFRPGGYGDWSNKELPQKFGKAKVREFGNWKNYCGGFFY